MTGKAIVLVSTLIAFGLVAVLLAPGTMAASLGTTSAEISYGTDQDVYNRGDTVNGFVEIRNTGNTVINNGVVSVSVSRNVPILGAMKIGSRDITMNNLNIKPGETMREEFSETIPAEFAGMSTAGKYRVTATVTLDGTDIGTYTKDIQVK
jgi:sporulation-control protein spo0M